MVKKFTSYAIVGGITFFIDAGITLGLATFLHYIVANTLGFAVANVVNFLLAHNWVFRGKLARADLVRTYFSVLAISVVGLLLSNLCMYLLIDHADMQLLPAKILTTLIVLVWNFFGRIAFVYNKA
jgi:putative flippase GtrA